MELIPDGYADPIALFMRYYEAAKKNEAHDATAVALATADSDGRPAVRMVLLKGIEDGDFHFYTNYGSRKAQHLAQNPRAAMCFYWAGSGVQIRVEGDIEKLSAETSDAYHASRPRGSQLAAWASDQSAPLDRRETLLERYREVQARFANGPVPRLPTWGGYRLIPARIEFWHSGPDRLHDRMVYLRDGDAWRQQRLFP